MRLWLSLLFLLLPLTSSAAVVINEIAWMGGALGANEEWIELYNSGSGDVSVDGWTLSDGASLTIPLAGTVEANSFALLERTDDETVSDITAFQIYTGALANTGATLTLRNDAGSTIDQVIGGENWGNIGGDNVTKATPQRAGSGWVTGTPTPGKVNISSGTSPDPEDTDEPDPETNVVAKDPNPDGVKISLVEANNELALMINSPSVAFVNQAIEFEGVSSGVGKTILSSLTYQWNFGDTYTSDGKTAIHSYEYPGEYAVVLHAAFARHDVSVRKVIKVLPVILSLSRTEQGDLLLKNMGSEDIDLSGYTINGIKAFQLPDDTILLGNGTLTIRAGRVGGIAMITDTEGVTIATEAMHAATVPARRFVEREEKEKLPIIATNAEPKVLGVSDTVVEDAATRTPSIIPVAAGVIPVYAEGEEESVPTRSSSLPYLGLLSILILGVLLIYRRPSEE